METTPETKVEEKEKQINPKEADESQPRSGNWKAAFRAGSNPMVACLPRAASIISANLITPMSPTRDYTSRANRSGVFRTQISIIPKEAMETKKDYGFEPREPTSPKVSCIGQVKKKKQACEERHRRRKDQDRDQDRVRDRPPLPSRPVDLKLSKLKRFFSGKKLAEPVFCESPETEKTEIPNLGEMKRFTSGRESDALANVYRESRKLAERCGDTNDAKVSPLVFYSGPLLNDLRPKSEVNLWKRRSMAPPVALNLQSSHGLQARLPLTR
ncbi:hypothetical protein KI387_043927 [Taxus chinensis]|uniref:Uncharacterized protein n=1 Tax=Taxus chinensis TaxID=29808 RepID=A0AA38GJ28_TAXCH|nr:hypothetical protein KI387_043927 [Taxus chinensis]